MKKLDIQKGQKYNDWTVLHRVYDHNLKTNRPVWACRCKCGTIRNIIQKDIPKATRCRKCEGAIKSIKYTKHGQSKNGRLQKGTRLYRIWQGMRTRCNNPNSKDYKWYGAKGVSVCPEWDDFNEFYQWAIQNGYDDSKTIDRIESDGPYSPSNCKWSTTKEQLRNRECTRYITINGVTKTMSEWSECSGINYQTLRTRVDKNWPEERLLDPPIQSHIPIEWPD